MDNADAQIRYRVSKELLKDEQTAKKIEPELFENALVQKWLNILKPQTPPQHRNMLHGCFDFNLENALPVMLHFGLHGDIRQLRDAIEFYINGFKTSSSNRPYRNCHTGFGNIMTANYLAMQA